MRINILTVLYLMAASLLDIRKREVSVKMTLVYVVFVMLSFAALPADPGNRLWSMACGGAAAVISLMNGEPLGMGDCIVIAALGLAYPIRSLLLILFASSVVCCIFCLLLVLRKKGAVLEEGIPFIPFLLAGTLCCIVL